MSARVSRLGASEIPAVPWGAGRLELGFPASWPLIEWVEPDLSGAEDLTRYAALLATALDHAVAAGGPRAEVGAALTPGATVAIVVDDPSRWTPVAEALPVLLRWLEARGIHREAVSVAVGVGRHQAVDDAAMRRRVGSEVVDQVACHSPPVDDLDAYDHLGETATGIPVRVFRPVARARVRFLIGSVLPHLQAGFGGGYKLVFPGCSHRTTLGALHRQGIGPEHDAATLLGGDPAANPMRRAIAEAAALLPGPSLSINHLLGRPGEILRIEVGEPIAVQAALAAEARQRFQTPRLDPADVVIAGNAPWPGDPMQSFKVLLQHRAACRPGGVLAGLFWTDPEEIARSFPLGTMRGIAATGAAGGWMMRHGLKLADRATAAIRSPAAFMVHWARELVVDRRVMVLAPPLFETIGPRLGPVRLFGARDPLWNAIDRATRADQPPRIRVFPCGGLTYAPELPS